VAVGRLSAMVANGGGRCVGVFFMRASGSLSADLEGSATATDRTRGRYPSWWLCFRVVGVGGGRRVGAA